MHLPAPQGLRQDSTTGGRHTHAEIHTHTDTHTHLNTNPRHLQTDPGQTGEAACLVSGEFGCFGPSVCFQSSVSVLRQASVVDNQPNFCQSDALEQTHTDSDRQSYVVVTQAVHTHTRVYTTVSSDQDICPQFDWTRADLLIFSKTALGLFTKHVSLHLY